MYHKKSISLIICIVMIITMIINLVPVPAKNAIELPTAGASTIVKSANFNQLKINHTRETKNNTTDKPNSKHTIFVYQKFLFEQKYKKKENKHKPSTKSKNSNQTITFTEEVKLDTQEAEEIIQYAKKFLGNPYVYGGTSLSNGCDCSGFTSEIYKHFGYKLNRTSKEQSNNGKEVKIKDIKKGDLVFYNYGGGISHVAIYIGKQKIIHASTEETGIIISDIKKPCCARRIL